MCYLDIPTYIVFYSIYHIACYNILMTAAPPVAIGLFDITCSDGQRMRNPRLYHGTQRSDFFNNKLAFQWVALSILHSLVLYWIPVWFYGDGIIWENGFNADYLTLGNIVYTCVILTVNFKAGLEIDAWNVFHHLSVWGSIVVWFLLFLGYSELWGLGIRYSNWPADMSKMFELVMSSPSLYLSLLIVPFTALIVDIIIKYLRCVVFPDETEMARKSDKLLTSQKVTKNTVTDVKSVKLQESIMLTDTNDIA